MDSIERFREAIAASGIQGSASGYPESVLRGLERELAPLGLPPSLRDLWACVNVGSLPIAPGSDVATPFTTWFADVSVSWWLWRASRDRHGLFPEVLLPIVSYGRVMQAAELTDDSPSGGRVFEWRRGSGHLELVYSSIDAWLGVMADLVTDTSASLLHLSEDARWLEISDERERELRRTRVAPRADAPIANDPATWPRHWQKASRHFDDRRPLRPPEMSIAEFRWDPPARATVAGVLEHGGRQQEAMRLRMLDGTGWLDVWCPAELDGLWVTAHEASVELEVVPYTGAWPPAGLSHPDWPPYPPHATATRLRLRRFG